MSFVITLSTREGIVMAADSRLTLNQNLGNPPTVVLSVSQSDANYKLFLAPNGVGISTFGAADIAGVPLAGYIESFMAGLGSSGPVNVGSIAQQLLAHFSAFAPLPQTQFHVAGYDTTSVSPQQQVWSVDVLANSASQLNSPGLFGANWGGESDILARLVQPVQIPGAPGQPPTALPAFQIPWQFFTLQDAIDFAFFAVQTTIEAIRFQPRPKTVGGPVDVLVIKPGNPQWIQRKALHTPSGT